MNEMGDTFELNVVEEAIKKDKKYCFSGTKRFHFCVSRATRFSKALWVRRKHYRDWCYCDTPEVHFAWLNTAKDNGGIEGYL